MQQRLEAWETLAAGLGVGLLAHASPLAAGLLLAMVWLYLLASGKLGAGNLKTLLALALVTAAAMLLGPQGGVLVALLWRIWTELSARAGASAHLLLAPIALLSHTLEAPLLLQAGLFCIAIVGWIDWSIRRLAAWRLDEPPSSAGFSQFFLAQAVVVAPLLIFPTPLAALAAITAMGLARQLVWEVRAPLAHAAR
jgi:hypothetical protein